MHAVNYALGSSGRSQATRKQGNTGRGLPAEQEAIKVMRKLLGVATVAALALGAGVALADDVTGKIKNIDLTANTFQVGSQTFQWSSSNSGGVKLKDLKEGDMVKVMYEPTKGGKENNDVMSISKEK
jgi:hypothetical protein